MKRQIIHQATLTTFKPRRLTYRTTVLFHSLHRCVAAFGPAQDVFLRLASVCRVIRVQTTARLLFHLESSNVRT